jgi:HPt (histidine-containing phosphotransfer) domain-containing protein
MDGYTPKPVSPQALMRAMDEALQRAKGQPGPGAQTDAAPELAPRAPAAVGAIDVDKLRRRLDGDDATLRQLAQAMRSDLGERLAQLQQALQAKNTELAVAHAHGLRGSLSSMTAERGARLSKGLELAALSQDWKLFERALPLMQAEAQQIDAALAALLSAPPPGA